MSQELTITVKKAILRIVAVAAFLMSVISLLYYYCEQYDFFISAKHHGDYIYPASGIRLAFRMAYPVALAGIFFYRKWGVTLLIMVWVIQITLFTIFFHNEADAFNADYFISLIPLLLMLALIYWCRQLFSGKILIPVLIYFLVALAIHSALFFSERY